MKNIEDGWLDYQPIKMVWSDRLDLLVFLGRIKMSLPVPLLMAVENHACFSGCYSHNNCVRMCFDPHKPPSLSFSATCQDCLVFEVGGLANVLPPGMTQYGLAQTLTDYVRTFRGYRWSISGYHAIGSQFWLSAAYYGNGLFILDSSRNSGNQNDLDYLMDAFRYRLCPLDDQGMMDPTSFSQQNGYLNMDGFLSVKNKDDILNSVNFSPNLKSGFRKVTIAQYLPMEGSSSASGIADKGTAGQGTAGKTISSLPDQWSDKDVGKICPGCGKMIRLLVLGGSVGYNCGCR